MAFMRRTALSLSMLVVVQLLLSTHAHGIPHPDAQHASLNANAWQPGINGKSLLFTESPLVLEHFALRGFFATQLIHRPLVVRRSSDEKQYRSLLTSRPEVDLGFAVGLWGFLETGIYLPVVLGQDGEFVGRKMGDIAAYGVGDMSMYVKGQILNQKKNAPFSLGVSALLFVPSGNQHAYMGYSTVAGEPKIMLSYTIADISVGGTVGFLLQPKTTLYNAVDTHKIRTAFSVGYPIKAIRTRLATEVLFNAQLQKSTSGGYAPGVQLLGSAAVDVTPTLAVLASGGAGLTRGMGTPDYRLLLGLSIGYDDLSDADQDGVALKHDRCPDVPEDRDNFEDTDGCPESDNDQDGILDVTDQCPNDPEDMDGYGDDDGCPETDNDGDGLEDGVDQCPNEAEDRNGIADDDGCPEAEPEPEIEESADGTVYISIESAVFFDFGKAMLRPQSHRVLRRILKAVRNYPRFTRLRIEGFTDNIGSKAYNIRLSQQRAEAVQAFFISQGMPARQLEAIGRGMSLPRARNTHTRGRQINRRVEFIIIAEPPTAPESAETSPSPSPIAPTTE